MLSSRSTVGLLARFRVCHALQVDGLGLLGRMARRILGWRYRVCQARCGIELPAATKVGPGLRLPHRGGVVIHPNAVIGRDCEIAQCVTIGNNLTKSRYEVAVIGDGVVLCAGTKVIGPVRVGDDVCVGANSVVIHDVPPNTIVAGSPARKIGDVPTE